jgi:hypothetical protein
MNASVILLHANLHGLQFIMVSQKDYFCLAVPGLPGHLLGPSGANNKIINSPITDWCNNLSDVNGICIFQADYIDICQFQFGPDSRGALKLKFY